MKKLIMPKARLERRRGISLLPNLLTTCGLYAGFYSIISSVNGNFFHAAVAIVISGVFDGLDGRIARITRTTSLFGIEYDSLSDLVAFGVAPAVLVYLWALQPFGRLGWVIGFLFLACGALRLARFNANVSDQDPKYFQGLSIPAGAGMIAATVFLFDYLNLEGSIKQWAVLITVIILSFLMVSNLKYISLKGELVKKKPFNSLVVTILMLAMISVQPQVTLYVIGLVYIISGPVLTVLLPKPLPDEDEAELETPAVKL
ncbi:MAG: CDP-diacylglycerol--serine O-phosphatidyltransferase [Deltaproteobacteria bacterium]|nr:CDP-diacylglycerol--serine O-phosphatidyltransferase [Deltaproteobacteria bacterium]MBW2051784.1 CDP-diacylglycerol--serine O-phosphatidyltransferase [Deltaproteobacteria bacterium]MBW2140630.1 CDP-diacylglycerol--serine O-phosphatidyltransferase [Deltaproteobacteria bacterium]MBW2323307.1 CDP-diacylglycerol--serine O-phosphatidyltransferase [Deltaproteobacteria bacterium]